MNMKNSQKAKHILLFCALAVGIVSAVIIWQSIRPSPGKPYEQVTMEQAQEFMAYETGYILVDISSEAAFQELHPEGAVNVPYDQLGDLIFTVFPDKEQQIYICGKKKKQRDRAASKLCILGYTNVTEITDAYKNLK